LNINAKKNAESVGIKYDIISLLVACIIKIDRIARQNIKIDLSTIFANL